MDCFSKAEIAGIVDNTAFDRESNKLRLLIKIPPEGLDLVAIESDILGETGSVTLIEVEIIDEAFDFLLGKVYDFDYIHVLADIHNCPFARIPIKFVVSGVGQILCHKPHAYLNREDKGNDVFKVLKCFRLIKKAGD